MSRKALLLFAVTSVIWGSSFLFIRVAVEHMPPSAVVSAAPCWGRLPRPAHRDRPLVHPALGVTAVMTILSRVIFVAPAAATLPHQVPAATGLLALAVLGIVNTGVAYWLFYLLIDEAGAASASVITYLMPVVAMFLGVGLLGERLTAGAIGGWS